MSTQEKEIFKLFIDESNEQIEKIEEGIISLEEEFSEETIKEVFRMIHSLKGSSLSMGFEELADFTHDIETLLDRVRSKTISLNRGIIDLLFECLDKIKEIKNNIVQDNNDNVDTSEVRKKIINTVGKQYIKKAKKGALDEFNITEYELLIMDDAVKREQKVFIIKTEISKESNMRAMKAFLAINNLKNIGQVLRVWPQDYETAEDDNFGNEFKVILITSKDKETVEKNIDAAGEISKIIIDEFKGKDAGEESKIDIKVNEKLEDNLLFRLERRSYIRVDIDKLDRLIGLVGELVIDNGRLLQVSDILKLRYKGDPEIKELLSTVVHIDFIGTELQDAVMGVRVYTVENIFNKLHRMIRDLAKRSNKEVNFFTEGKETELDRGILEEIVDPLVHLLRNAIDHGIETMEERASKGKERSGTITLRAKHQENSVIIEVDDDGKGLDLDAIKQKAIDRNLLSVDDLEDITDREVTNFIFLPGFSTAKVVTDISGRGVGMDVVKTNIEKLNGTIEVETEINKGTKFTIKLPLTLAIIQGLLIKEGKINFAVPLSSVIETIRLTQDQVEEQIKKVKGKEVYVWREQVLPVIKLGDYFNIESDSPKNKIFLLVVGFMQKRICFIVDNLTGEQQIVIKNLGEYLGKGKILGDVKGISGATILGDGSFAYVMDIPEILKDLKDKHE